MYRARPGSGRNRKPRPKSGKRYARRYRYPASKKSVFRHIRCYRYEPRPVTPKNYFPRPKSSNRYVYAGRPVKIVQPNPYQKKSIFRPVERYVCTVRPTQQDSMADKRELFRFGC